MEALKPLVVAAQNDDRHAFSQIVLHFQDMAYATANAILGDDELAQDAAQEAFIEAYLCLPGLREPLAFPGWLRRIIFKHCDRLTRGKRVMLLPMETLSAMPSSLPDPSLTVEMDQMNAAVRDAMAELPYHQQLVMKFFYVQGYSQQEIAEFLELPVTTIKKRLYDARKNLKGRFNMAEGQEYTPSQDEEFANKVQFFVALKSGDVEQIVALLKQYPELVEAKTEWGIASDGYYWPTGITALHWAAATGNTDLITKLLAQGINVNLQTDFGKTPLHLAALMQQAEAAHLLIANGAEVDLKTKRGHTPLHYAVFRNSPELVELLLPQAAVNAMDERRYTPLDWAVVHQYGKLAQLLRAHGGTQSMIPETQFTPRTPKDTTLIETGIKIVDLFAPFKRGGQVGFFTPLPHAGKMVLLMEIVYNLTIHQGVYVVWMSLEEGHYTSRNLMFQLREWGTQEQIIPVFGQPDDSPVGVARKALKQARWLSDKGHEVVLVVESKLARAADVMPVLQGKAGSSITIFYYGDEKFEDALDIFKNLDAVITLDPGRAKEKLYPAVDVGRSRAGDYQSEDHQRVAEAVRDLLRRYRNGDLDEVETNRASRIDSFLTQAFVGAEPWTGNPGRCVSSTDTIRGCQQLLEGHYADVLDESLAYIGPLEDVNMPGR